MKCNKLIYIIGFFIVFASCKKAENRSCFKFVGNEKTKEVEINEFYKLKLYEHVKFELVQDTVNKVVLIGGENLLNEISINVSENTLTITNNNKCNFLRNYDKVVKAEIHFKDLKELDYLGSETLTNRDILNLPWFSFSMKKNSSTIDLNIKSIFLFANTSGGYADYILRGSADYACLTASSNGYCDANNLIIKDSLNVVSNTMGEMKINADKVLLRAEVKLKGNIYCIGIPSSSFISEINSGKLILE